jgi:hypothetical protein
LLASESLYFACPTQFRDPFEGFLPRSHIEAESKMIQQVGMDPILSLRQHFAGQALSLQRFDELVNKFASEVRTATLWARKMPSGLLLIIQIERTSDGSSARNLRDF